MNIKLPNTPHTLKSTSDQEQAIQWMKSLADMKFEFFMTTEKTYGTDTLYYRFYILHDPKSANPMLELTEVK